MGCYGGNTAPFHGRNDIRPLDAEVRHDEPIRVEVINARLTNRVHFFHYSSRLRTLMNDGFDLIHAWEEPYIFVGMQIASSAPKNVPLVFRTAQSLDKSYVAPFNWFERYSVNRMNGWIYSGYLVEKNCSVVQVMATNHGVMLLSVSIHG